MLAFLPDPRTLSSCVTPFKMADFAHTTGDNYGDNYFVKKKDRWLAQLVERQSAVREVEGSIPRPDQHSGS